MRLRRFPYQENGMPIPALSTRLPLPSQITSADAGVAMNVANIRLIVERVSFFGAFSREMGTFSAWLCGK